METSLLDTASQSDRAILHVSDLRKLYDGRPVVDGVSFDVKHGEIFGILGPNGAGKTTTLEMIEAMRPMDGGTILLDGINVAEQPDRIKRIIGVQPQSPAFQDKTRLTEIIQLFAAAYGQSVDPLELLRRVQLEDKAASYVESLSGGQKQRLSIAAALVHDPIALFMDEPTTGLDPQARRHLWDLVKQIRSQGVTVILTTHYMDEAELLCDRVAIMDNGKIISQDTPHRLIDDLLGRGFKRRRTVRQATLEDVFIDLTGKGLRE